MLEQYFKEDVKVRNSAANGASAGSYIENGTYKMVMDSFKYLLKHKYIESILEKGAHPIPDTSVVSCSYDESGELYQMRYADHAQAMRH